MRYLGGKHRIREENSIKFEFSFRSLIKNNQKKEQKFNFCFFFVLHSTHTHLRDATACYQTGETNIFKNVQCTVYTPEEKKFPLNFFSKDIIIFSLKKTI